MKKRNSGRFDTVIRTEHITHLPTGKPVTEVVFHVATAEVSAEFAASLIRGHWHIENRWHGLRDLGFREDASTATGLTARGLAYVRTWAINLARSRGLALTIAQRERFRDPRHLFRWACG